MTNRQKLLTSLAGAAVALLISAGMVMASSECVPVYGVGVVCPTVTPAPTVPPAVAVPPALPATGAEQFFLPGFISLFAWGVYLVRRAKMDVNG